jgi:hypothetical protein
LAASVAVALGAWLARAQRERRAAADRLVRERRFGLLARERVGDGLRRATLAQLDIAIEALQSGGATGVPRQQVHEARKALKRLRALIRLLRGRLGETAYERDSTTLRDAGRLLAGAREAEVLLSTLDELLERNPQELASRGGVRRLRARLQAECDGLAQRALAGAPRSRSLEQLCAMRARVEHWELVDVDGLTALEPALGELYGKGRTRMRRARRAKRGGGGRKLHEWRKRVKDLRYAAEALQRDDERSRSRASKKRKRDGKRKRAERTDRQQAAYIAVVAKRADALGELLGDEHDLAVLAERVRAEAKREDAALGARSRKALLRAIAKRRARLRRRALRRGERLYGRSRKKFLKRMRRAAARQAAISRR